MVSLGACRCVETGKELLMSPDGVESVVVCIREKQIHLYNRRDLRYRRMKPNRSADKRRTVDSLQTVLSRSLIIQTCLLHITHCEVLSLLIVLLGALTSLLPRAHMYPS